MANGPNNFQMLLVNLLVRLGVSFLFFLWYHYFAPGIDSDYCDEWGLMPVCVSVCLSVCVLARRIYVHVSYRRGSVLVWRRCDMSCMFPVLHITPCFQILALYMARYARQQNTTSTIAEVPTIFCSTTNNSSKYSSRLAHGGEVCYLQLPYSRVLL